MAVNIKQSYLFLLDNRNQLFMPTERPVDEAIDEKPPHTHYFSCGLGGSFFY